MIHKVELISDILLWTNKDRTSSNNISVLIQDVVLKTYWERWTTETGGERESRRSVRDTMMIYIYIYIYVCVY